MAIKRKKKHGRVYLEEYRSVRINGKVKSIYVRSLGPENPVPEAKKPKPRILDRLEHSSSYRTGDIALLFKIAQQLNYIDIIDGICCGETGIEGPSPGKILTVWAINRVIDPLSATELENWVPTTYLPQLLAINPADFTKSAFLTSLDFICYDDRKSGSIQDYTAKIDDALYRRWREIHPLQRGERETLAYDLTSILFFGVKCPLAELSHNAEGIKRQQANVALVVSRKDKYPVTHFVYEGKRNGVSTIKNLISRLQKSSVEPGTLIWDRGNVSNELVNIVDDAHWKLICGVPKSRKEVKDIIKHTKIDYSWDSLVRTGKKAHIYAVTLQRELYGKERSVTVYSNRERGIRECDARNEALSEINDELQTLASRSSSLSEKIIRESAKRIISEYEKFVDFGINRTPEGPRLWWKFRKRQIRELEKMDGRYLLLTTDPSLSTKEVVNTYLEKDFIEKVFRTLKTLEEIEPVRHRLETRVRAYVFVCVLAYRLLAALQCQLQLISEKNSSWERAESLLMRLGRVERVEVRLGHQMKTWFLNLSQKDRKILKKMGFSELVEEKVVVDFRL